MSTVRRKPRTHRPDRVRDALLAQVEFLRLAVDGLTPGQFDRETGLPGWEVRHLVAHLVRQIDSLPRLLAEPAPPGNRPACDVSGWVLSTGSRAKRLDEEARRDAAAIGDLAAALRGAAEELESVIETGIREDVLLPVPFGSMRALDFTVTRLVETVVHADDLTRALGSPVRLDRMALATTVRVLADAVADRAPGSSTEVRIPPFAVVQCLAGPRHTRGTPPNVVETDPITWMRLASGRVAWRLAVATGRLKASGERAGSLADHLPVLG
ncbi:maleylpyruvate isomerase family mycothiol-dependent enzyme [Streptomyces calidiresistens]|uniref:Maleylpyruvate isomerase family mycothiol-dependent enzyme n=1 Tax=Streptomyces calidiresistens TaxID=1485586 RepID=A0A7W3XV72_9ACTN|nr:maleylpyruvate isomerase family mycothiol-dependent enzyme [Streptomyces calidiresistens]MBB0228471.1 maleylpyruvate isomerase family mycothiol-dependent enzyme [Streptomyces calidiresistens]